MKGSQEKSLVRTRRWELEAESEEPVEARRRCRWRTRTERVASTVARQLTTEPSIRMESMVCDKFK